MFVLEEAFVLDEAFMFRFEADPGQPENENHKVIPTRRIISRLGMPAIQEIIRRFLSITVQWYPLDFDKLGSAHIYYDNKHEEVGLCPTLVSNETMTRKVVWIMLQEDIEEVNGVVRDGNSRARVC